MITEDDRPIGAPVLRQTRRDRLSIWIAEHRWAVPVIRLVGGLSLTGVAILAFGTPFHVGKLIVFVIGVALGGRAREREKERGDTLLDALRTGGDMPAPPTSLPSEFDAYFHQSPDPRSDDRYFGHR